MFDDLLKDILKDEPEMDRERSSFETDDSEYWETTGSDVNWTVFDTPAKDRIWVTYK